jgi:hypothetical protein
VGGSGWGAEADEFIDISSTESDEGMMVFGWVEGNGSDKGMEMTSLGEEDIGTGGTALRDARVDSLLEGGTAPPG